MAIKINFENVKGALDKYTQFNGYQLNIDANTNADEEHSVKNPNKQIELVNINGIDSNKTNSLAMYEAIVDEQNKPEGKQLKNGLSNKFILYRCPKNSSVNEASENQMALKYKLNHTGLYFCDDQQNIYLISPDYRFNDVVVQSLLAMYNKINELESKINNQNSSYSYSYIG